MKNQKGWGEKKKNRPEEIHTDCNLAIGNYVYKRISKEFAWKERFVFGIYEMKGHRGRPTKEVVK